MGYKKTGNPPGRPRKDASVLDVAAPVTAAPKLSRAHKQFRGAAQDLSAGLHRPPRHKRQPGVRRPMLHPNVIANNG